MKLHDKDVMLSFTYDTIQALQYNLSNYFIVDTNIRTSNFMWFSNIENTSLFFIKSNR